MEEFHPIVKHVAGKENDAADALSQLDITEDPADTVEWLPPNKPLTYADEEEQLRQLLFPLGEEVPEESQGNNAFPLAPDMIQFYQQKDTEIMSALEKDKRLTTKTVEGHSLIHKEGKILIPDKLKQQVMEWYHNMLVHPGGKRMELSIRSVFTWKGLRKDVQDLCKHCHTCQMFKKSGRKKYGLLPEKAAEVTKWQRVNVDLWGPATVHNKNGTLPLSSS